MAPMSWLFDSVLGLSLLAFSLGAIAVAVLAQIAALHSLKAAAWLTSPCQGNIVRLQILWLSGAGGAPDLLQESVTLLEAGNFPTPGPQIVEFLAPLMQDGSFNLFTLPVPVPIQQNQTFVVALTFLEAPVSPNDASVVRDTDGCQAGKNGIFEISPSAWSDSCDLGLQGDFAIRAVVDCGDVGAQLTVIKTVVNDDGGTAVASDWTMDITGTNVSSTGFPGQEAPGVTVSLDAGAYSVDESGGPSGYVKSLSADCSGTIALGESKTCTITNDDTVDMIFSDGFESGDISAWSHSQPPPP